MAIDGLRDLLTDPTDVAEVLALLDEAVPATAPAAKARLQRLLDDASAEQVRVLLQHASGIARMLDDITAWCEQHGTPLVGRLQIRPDGPPLERGGLDTSWAGVDTNADAAERARALGHELLAVDVGGLGQSVAVSRGLRPYGDGMREVFRDRVRLAPDDVRRVRGLLDRLAGVAASPVPPSLAAAAEQVHQALDTSTRHLREGPAPADPAVSAVVDRIDDLLSRVPTLQRDHADAQRVEAGLGQFLRTEFWVQRWRIYELWVLVLVMRVLAEQGSEITPQGLTAGSWDLPYGRSQCPVALCSSPIGELRLYYQYWRAGPEGAHMPDVALFAPEGDDSAILVLDPKHGRSYTRSSVQRTAQRYAKTFRADLTAVMNYYDAAYGYESSSTNDGDVVLASGVAPGRTNTRLLEAQLAGTMAARRGSGAPRAVRRPARRRLTQESGLLYYARVQREVDEEAGFWLYRSEFGPRRLEQQPLVTDLRRLSASPDGTACLLVAGSLHLLGRAAPLAEARDPETSHAAPVSQVGWTSDSSQVFVQRGEWLQVFSATGDARGQRRLPSGTAVAWLSSDTLLLVEPDWKAVRARRWVPATGGEADLCDPLSLGEFVRPSVSLQSPGPRRPAVVTVGTEHYALSADGFERCAGPPPFLSPRSGHALEVVKGKQRGVTLARTTRAGDPPSPYVRWYGKAPASVEWSPDESRLAATVPPEHGRHGSERRIITWRIGDRHATPVALPGQSPLDAVWVAAGLFTAMLQS